MEQEKDEYGAFKSLLTRLARVPKREIDKKEEERVRKETDERQPTKPGQIATTKPQ